MPASAFPVNVLVIFVFRIEIAIVGYAPIRQGGEGGGSRHLTSMAAGPEPFDNKVYKEFHQRPTEWFKCAIIHASLILFQLGYFKTANTSMKMGLADSIFTVRYSS
jgi:hypothetical protein